MEELIHSINLHKLDEGEHLFEYCLDNKFFAALEQEEISQGEVYVTLNISYSNDTYRLNIAYDGYIIGQCDRCLSDLEIDVDFERLLLVQLGAEYKEESDELIILPKKEAILPLDWIMYEDLILSLPMQRLHEDTADCDPEMMSYYSNMLVSDIPTEEVESVEKDEDGIDKRWAGLKELRKN